MSTMHLMHIPLGSIIRTESGQICIVLPSVQGKRVLECPFRRDAASGCPHTADTYQITASIHCQVELIKTPTQAALDVALTLYDADRAERIEENTSFTQYANDIMEKSDGKKA